MNESSLKKLSSRFDFSFRRRVPMIFQTESAECGLICLTMISAYYGKNIDVTTLRQEFNISSRGTKLSGLIALSQQFGLSTRALSLDMDELCALKLPCILHWEFNHFVVLVSIRKNMVVLHDPALGRRVVRLIEVSEKFTGVALEVWPDSTFEATSTRSMLSLRSLIGSIKGLKRALGKIFCLSLVIETINMLMPVGTQLVMDHAIPAGEKGLLTLICISLMFLIILRAAVSMLRAWSSLFMSTLINVQWQSGLFNHLLRLPISFFERRRMGDILSRFGSLEKMQEAFTASLVGALMDSIMVIGVLIMMILYGGHLTWYVIGFTMIYIFIRLLTYSTYRQLSEENLIKGARVESYFMETLYSIATVKMQGLVERRCMHWLNLEIDAINSSIKVRKMEFLFGGFNSFINALDQVIILWLGVNLVISNDITLGMFIAFGAFRDQFTNRMSSLIDFVLQFRMLNLHNQRISDIALQPNELIKPTCSTFSPMQPVSLEARNLSYRYDCQSSPVFYGLNLHIKPGESVAITGSSGTGKTTLMKVLCGLFEPEVGQVLVDDVDVKNLGANNYRKTIGCVMQDDKLLSGTIRENICNFDECYDEEWMIHCAKASYIHDVIMQLPMRYDSIIGEIGEGLSGGQKQRIYIARALYRKPGILFMDEATSSLDHESEGYINRAIKALNITRVIIAHRESTIASADRMILLSQKDEYV